MASVLFLYLSRTNQWNFSNKVKFHTFINSSVSDKKNFIKNVILPTGARFTKAYDVTIQKYRNSHSKIEDSKMHILRCMGSKFCVKFQRCPLKFHTKFWTHTLQNMHFTEGNKSFQEEANTPEA